MVSNKVTLIGRLGKDVELRHTGDGIPVTSFSLAVKRGYSNADKEVETDWIDCSAWRKTAEFISKYFSKGDKMAICGRLQVRKVEKDGETKWYTEVVVDEVEFAGDKKSSVSSSSVTDDAEVPYNEAPADEDSDPF